MAGYTLIGGTKNWSSWSLRPWILMKVAGIPFNEIEIALREGDATRAAIRAHSPSGFIPLLRTDEGWDVWDSLAICEFLAERHPVPALWPQDPRARAAARAVSAEMHSGFAAMRREMGMACLERRPLPDLSADAKRDVARVGQIWRETRAAFGAGGPFLFGAFSIADAMYAPVVSRFTTYAPPLGPIEADYVHTITMLPAMQEWVAACAAWAARRADPPA